MICNLASKYIVHFIIVKIIYYYGVLHELIGNHGSHFKDETTKFLE